MAIHVDCQSSLNMENICSDRLKETKAMQHSREKYEKLQKTNFKEYADNKAKLKSEFENTIKNCWKNYMKDKKDKKKTAAGPADELPDARVKLHNELVDEFIGRVDKFLKEEERHLMFTFPFELSYVKSVAALVLERMKDSHITQEAMLDKILDKEGDKIVADLKNLFKAENKALGKDAAKKDWKQAQVEIDKKVTNLSVHAKKAKTTYTG